MEQFTFYTKIIRKQIKVALGELELIGWWGHKSVYYWRWHLYIFNIKTCPGDNHAEKWSRSFRAPRIQAVSPNAYNVCLHMCTYLDTLANIVYRKYLVMTFISPGPWIFQKNPGCHITHLTYPGSTARPCDLFIQTVIHRGCLWEHSLFASWMLQPFTKD